MLAEREVIEAEARIYAGVYQKFPVVISRGEGALLYDLNGKEYIDCMGGYGVSLVGHCNPKVVEAIKRQSEKLIACHASLYNDARAVLLEKLVSVAPKGLEKVYLGNSGAEAVECALKLAVKYTGRSEVVSMMRGYHGKTSGALSLTWNQKYRKAFQSLLISNIHFVPFGNPEKLEEKVTERTAAVIIEPVQGEGGIHVAPEGFLQRARQVCDEKNVLLIFDEVQCGLGRTGKMWASQHWNVTPDVMCVGKGLAGGLPIGATLAKAEVMDSLRTGEQTSTFGGNPLTCAAASATLDFIVEEKLPQRAWELGSYFKELLEDATASSRLIREVRGLGLMLGLESRFGILNILLKGLEKGLILLYAGKNVVRFLPPIIIEREQLEKATAILRDILEEEESERFHDRR